MADKNGRQIHAGWKLISSDQTPKPRTGEKKAMITSINIYKYQNEWAYRADDEMGFDHSDTLDAETEVEATREVSAMFPGATITRVADCNDSVKRRLIGYDASSENRPRVLCAECGLPSDGSPIYDGDGWGSTEFPCCSECGEELRGVTLVS